MAPKERFPVRPATDDQCAPWNHEERAILQVQGGPLHWLRLTLTYSQPPYKSGVAFRRTPPPVRACAWNAVPYLSVAK